MGIVDNYVDKALGKNGDTTYPRFYAGYERVIQMGNPQRFP